MAKAKAVSTRTATAVRSPEELTREYFETLRKVQAEAQKEIEHAHRKLVSVPQELQTKARNQALGAINSYVEAVKGAIGQTDSGPRIEQGVRTYAGTIQATAENVQKELTDALQDYANALKEVPETVRKGVNSAYTEYVAELRDNLTEIDWDNLEPQTLAALAQSMLAVALYTSSASGR